MGSKNTQAVGSVALPPVAPPDHWPTLCLSELLAVEVML